MIFSEQKWNAAQEIKPYIPVTRSFEFSSIQSYLTSTYINCICTLLGNQMKQKLQQIYDSVNDIKQINPESDQIDMQLLYLAQRSCAFLAMSKGYNTLQIQITDGGIKEAGNSDFKTPYKYRENALMEEWAIQGYNALDRLCQFLEQNIESFPEYKDSEYFQNRKRSIVRGAEDINPYYNIDHSMLLYLQITPHIRIIEDTVIAPRIGFKLFSELKQNLQTDNSDAKYEGLRKVLIPVISLYAVSRVYRYNGTLTDKGFIFNSTDDSGAFVKKTPATDSQVFRRSEDLEKDAQSYWPNVDQYIKENFDQQTDQSFLFKRDNTGKKSFWA